MRSPFCVSAFLVFVATSVSSASAQSRPLPIETVEGAGAGNVIVRTSVDYTRDVRFTLSGLEGDLWRLALVRLDIGLSSIADLEISGGLRDHLTVVSASAAPLSNLLRPSNPSSTGAFEDAIVGTKVRLRDERDAAPGVAVRIATRLPNAKHPSGLGQNTTDFYTTVIVGHVTPVVHVTGNIGVGILGDPLRANRHVASALYCVALSRPIPHDTTLSLGVDGRTGPLEPGLESRAIGRAAAGWTHGSIQAEVGGTVGLTSRDGNLGVAAAIGFKFHAFSPSARRANIR